VDEAERLLILRTLEFTGQNKTRAAEMLGVSLKTLHNKLKEYEYQRELKRGRRDGGGCAKSEPEDQTRLAITRLVFLVTDGAFAGVCQASCCRRW
jgi:transposase